MAKRVSVEEGVAEKMSKHHKARAGAREDARKELLEKAQAQVAHAVAFVYVRQNNEIPCQQKGTCAMAVWFRATVSPFPLLLISGSKLLHDLHKENKYQSQS